MSRRGGKYELNEKDIESVIRFLQVTDPEHATPEMAIAVLEYFQAKFHEMSHTDPEKLLEIYTELKKDKIRKKLA